MIPKAAPGPQDSSGTRPVRDTPEPGTPWPRPRRSTQPQQASPREASCAWFPAVFFSRRPVLPCLPSSSSKTSGGLSSMRFPCVGINPGSFPPPVPPFIKVCDQRTTWVVGCRRDGGPDKRLVVRSRSKLPRLAMQGQAGRRVPRRRENPP